MDNRRLKNDAGFTLVELIVVITIIAVLAAILIPTVGRYIEDANRTRIMANAKNVYVACTVAAANDMAKNIMTAGYEGIPELGEDNFLEILYEYVPFTGELEATSNAEGRIIWFLYTEGPYTFGLMYPYGDKPDYNFDPNPKVLPG